MCVDISFQDASAHMHNLCFQHLAHKTGGFLGNHTLFTVIIALAP